MTQYSSLKSLYLNIAIFATLVLALTSCGLPPGGDISGKNKPQLHSSSWNNKVTEQKVGGYRTAEYQKILAGNDHDAYDSIHLAEAYSILEQNNKNIAGDNYIVGVIDSGININHKEFKGKIVKFNHTDKHINDVSGYGVGHGSHVSGIIAASKDESGMHGVAFNAKIAPYKIFGNNKKYYSLSNAINQAIKDEIKIINMSLASGGDHKKQFLAAKNNNTLSIIAAGNSGGGNPVYPAKYAIEKNLKGSIIAVGNYQNSTEERRYNSNKCGEAKDYCLFAPGTYIRSAIHAGGNNVNRYEYYSGTSMAAPIVSGAAAILRSAWPHLTNIQTTDILLKSATDIGETGVDKIYGHGLLNVENAVNKIGNDSVTAGAKVANNGYSASNSKILTSKVFGDAFNLNIAPIIKHAIYFDDYGRDYKANLDQRVSAQSHHSILSNLVFNDHKSTLLPLIKGKNALQLKLSQTNSYNNFNNPITEKYLVIDKENHYKNKDKSKNLSLSFSNQINEETSFGFVSNDFISSLNNQFTSEYFLISNNSSYFNDVIDSNPLNNDPVNNNTQQKAFFITQKMNDSLSSNFSYRINNQGGHLSNSDISSKIISSKLNYKLPTTNLSLDYSQLTEYQDRFLGGVALGAFSNSKDSHTDSITFSSKNQILKDLYLISSYAEGRTNLSGNKDGILRDFSQVKSSGYSLGLFKNNFFNGKFAINYSQPLRIYDSSVDINIPISRDNQGNVQRLIANNVKLEPSGRQRDLELSYGITGEDSALQFNFLLIQEPGHIANNKNEQIYYTKYHLKF